MAPLRNAIAGGIGGGLGGAGIGYLGALIFGVPFGGPLGWAIGAGAVGAAYGAYDASGSVSVATIEQAFRDGLLSGLTVGAEVTEFLADQAGRRQQRVPGNPARSYTAPPTALPSPWGFFTDNRQRAPRYAAACDLDLTAMPARGSLSAAPRFRVASGLAATCDQCRKILSVGNDWFHDRANQTDLCQSCLPADRRNNFVRVHCDEVLGRNSGYELKVRVPVDAFPQGGPRAEGKVVLEVSHLINRRSGKKETLASLLKPLMPSVMIEEESGHRSFCRVVIDMKDEAAVREVIRGLGQQRNMFTNKRVSVKEVRREFHSPRP